MNHRNIVPTAAAVTLALSILAAPASPQEITECDRLVAHPLDPDRITEGVPTSEVPHAGGIAACKKAIAENPGTARLHYQLGRVYFYDGQASQALPHLEIAAKAGYRQAQFVLGYVHDSGLRGLEKDSCKTESLWLSSARAGRLSAMVSYPHHVVRGRFADCTVTASKQEMMGFLEAAKERSLDYYQGVLVADLIEDLDAQME